MRVLVTGAYGLIGSAILARLHRDGHDLIAAGRSLDEARRRFPYAQWIEADFARLTTADAWRPLLADIDAVVNCVGVLQDGAPRRHAGGAGRGHLRACSMPACGRRPARRPHLGDRRVGAGADRVRAHQGAGRRASGDARSRLGDPAAGPGAGAGGLWRQRDAARPRRIAVGHAGGRQPGAGGERRRYRRHGRALPARAMRRRK